MGTSVRNDSTGAKRRVQRQHAARGFSLLEVTIAVACLAGLTALALTSLAPATDRMRLRAEAREIASLMGAARTRAIVTGAVAVMDFDARQNQIVSGNPAMVRQLPPTVSLRLDTTGSARDLQRIEFYPEGGSSGGMFALADRTRQIIVHIDWLTGRIEIAPEVVHGG